MDNALLLYIKKIIYSLREMESVYTDIDYIKETVGNIKITVEDIYTGNQISDWIKDLETSGASSATYNDPSRMKTLCGNLDAALNGKINTLLFKYAYEKNIMGTLFGTYCGDVSGVNWQSLTTPDSVLRNANAFRAVAKDSTALELCMNHSSFRPKIYNNYSVTESIIASVVNTNSALTKRKRNFSRSYDAYNSGNEGSVKWFVCGSVTSDIKNGRTILTYADNTTKEQTYDGSYTCNRFINHWRVSAGGSGAYWASLEFSYIDFA